MEYGEIHEVVAKAVFQGLAPNVKLDATSHLFSTLHYMPQTSDSTGVGDGKGWLGASPDGLITVPARVLVQPADSELVSTERSGESPKTTAERETELERWLRSHIGKWLVGLHTQSSQQVAVALC